MPNVVAFEISDLSSSQTLENMMYHAIEDWLRADRQIGERKITYPSYEEELQPLKSELGKEGNFKKVEEQFNQLAAQLAQSLSCTEDQAKAALLAYNQSGVIAKTADVGPILQMAGYNPLPADQQPKAQVNIQLLANGDLSFSYTKDCSNEEMKAEHRVRLQIPRSYQYNDKDYRKGVSISSRMIATDPALTEQQLQEKLATGINKVSDFTPSIKEDFKQSSLSDEEVLFASRKPRFFDYQYYAAKKRLGVELSWVEKVVDRVLNVLGKAPAITIVNQPEMKTPEIDRVRTPREIQQARALAAEVESHSTTAVVEPTTPRNDSPGKEIGIGK